MAISDNYQYSSQQPTNREARQPHSERAYSSVLNEVIASAKDVVRSEVNLFMTEFRQFQPHLTKHISQVVIFGTLLVMSVLPFLAFMVIGLGELLDGRYWLSSLIVSAVCAMIGGPLALSAFRKIKIEDINFSQTRRSLYEAVESTKQKLEKIKTSSKGSANGSKSYN
ncbi:MAG: hypothetical protein A2622_07820 [Bdellovibrionales bacterium RIFCSPHIGHO2_01_FULL_40_29]|nr:MAG: hypothetical protein A2622_07820 [Bdellovibrionales bacterium RIFCSPHIGHO2_01_FULL_40_29]OFZ33713.1 MAG: hypothetical protein A3D17_09910 [Bdellovibrionales bacterium RIFCSPHIGHO2_02_FULL_40_15]